jgi:hypothetical protein
MNKKTLPTIRKRHFVCCYTLGKVKGVLESVTIYKCQYVIFMKGYLYIVKEYPNTYFFEEELTKK